MHQRQCLSGHLVREVLHHAGAVPRVNGLRHAGFSLKEQLGIARYPCRRLRGQCDGFVHGIGVQRLRATKGRCDGFQCGSSHIVPRVLRGEGPSACLRVGPEHHGFGMFGAQLLHLLRPNQTGRAHFGDFLEMVHPARPEKT